MKNWSFDPAWKKAVGILSLLLLAVFLTELSIMELFSPVFDRLGPVAGGLLDAASVVLLCAGPLWLYLFRLLPSDPTVSKSAAWRPLVLALASIFLAEFLVMMILPHLWPVDDPLGADLVDAALTTLLCVAPLWRLLFRPEMRRRVIPMLDTPLRLYVLLLGSIFLSDLLQELLVPLQPSSSLLTPSYIIDAFLTTLFGAPVIWLLIARPLRKAARTDRERVAAVYAQVIDAIVVINPQGEINSFNPAAEKIFGYSAEEMIGKSVSLLLAGESATMADLMQRLTDHTAGQDAFNEFDCKSKDGRLLTMTISISQVLLGQPEFLLIMRDITSRRRMEQALRESELRFRQIFQQSEDGILFLKPGSCEVLDANEKAERIFGYARKELQEGALDQIMNSADYPALTRAVGGLEAGNVIRQEFNCRRKDGSDIIASLRAKIMQLQGVPVTYCTFRDITERIRLEEKARAIQARLIQANKMTSLGLLVSGVAHEINNPNNFVMANCELLARITEDMIKALQECDELGGEGIYLGGVPLAEVGDQVRRLVGGIATGSRRVNDIVTNLKGFARQEHNQQRDEVDLSQVARSAVSLLHNELIKYTTNFHLDLADHLPPVSGHGQQLGQVIMNLLMNACQALPGRESGIWLSTGFDPVKKQVYFAVRDEGHGMSADDRQRVLEPFFTTKLDSGGTGLGLYISESIVTEHGGTLEFSSEPGQGTIFLVQLPAIIPAQKEPTA